jgi:hypothetical protein
MDIANNKGFQPGVVAHIFLATQGMDMRKIMVCGQPWQKKTQKVQ